MLRTPSPSLRRAVGAVKLGIAATVGLLAVSPVLTSTQEVMAQQNQGPTASDVAMQTELENRMAEHDCSVDGFGADVIPGSALVERNDRIHHVSFDDGWAVFTGDAEGALLAVCRADL